MSWYATQIPISGQVLAQLRPYSGKYLTQNTLCPQEQWPIDATPHLNSGHLWLAILAAELPVGSADTFVTHVLQFNFSLYPILLPSLPPRSSSWKLSPIYPYRQISESKSLEEPNLQWLVQEWCGPRKQILKQGFGAESFAGHKNPSIMVRGDPDEVAVQLQGFQQ